MCISILFRGRAYIWQIICFILLLTLGIAIVLIVSTVYYAIQVGRVEFKQTEELNLQDCDSRWQDYGPVDVIKQLEMSFIYQNYDDRKVLQGDQYVQIWLDFTVGGSIYDRITLNGQKNVAIFSNYGTLFNISQSIQQANLSSINNLNFRSFFENQAQNFFFQVGYNNNPNYFKSTLLLRNPILSSNKDLIPGKSYKTVRIPSTALNDLRTKFTFILSRNEIATDFAPAAAAHASWIIGFPVFQLFFDTQCQKLTYQSGTIFVLIAQVGGFFSSIAIVMAVIGIYKQYMMRRDLTKLIQDRKQQFSIPSSATSFDDIVSSQNVIENHLRVEALWVKSGYSFDSSASSKSDATNKVGTQH
eukprot:403352686